MLPHDLQALYSLAPLILFISMTVTVVTTKETPLRATSPANEVIDQPLTYGSSDEVAVEETDGLPPQRVSFIEAARYAPFPFWRVFLVQCFTWFGWFTVFVFGTSWVGAEVFNGSFTAAEGTQKRELYDSGVRMGNLGLALQSVVTIASSPLLTPLMHRTSAQAVYFLASVVFGVSLSSALVLTQRWQAWLATGALAATGFPWAVTMSIPWSLMSEAVTRSAPQNAGIYFTMFNLSQCIPEVLVSLITEEVMRVTGRQATVLAMGGMCLHFYWTYHCAFSRQAAILARFNPEFLPGSTSPCIAPLLPRYFCENGLCGELDEALAIDGLDYHVRAEQDVCYSGTTKL